MKHASVSAGVSSELQSRSSRRLFGIGLFSRSDESARMSASDAPMTMGSNMAIQIPISRDISFSPSDVQSLVHRAAGLSERRI
jgi:hypothetical protein